jgi:hypothetical protein
MTTLTAARKWNAHAWRPRDASGWIGLAASPICALMAWLAPSDATHIAICSSAQAMLPVSGMAWMYLLMSLFHVSPWLRLFAGQRRPTLPCN